MSTFGGISAMGDAMQAAMQAMAITAKNIANANTPGYSREDISFIPSDGTGGPIVVADDPERIRDESLDGQYREDNADYQEFKTILEGLEGIESIISEVDGGLSSALSEMEAALQAFINDPTDVDAANAFRTATQKVTSILNTYYDGLVGMAETAIEQLEQDMTEINQLLNQIAAINEEIRIAEAVGEVPPEMLDARDMYLDQLSNYLEFEVTENDDGTINIITEGANGEEVYLLDNRDHDNVKVAELDIRTGGYPDVPITIVDETSGATLDPDSGSLSGSLMLLNGKGSYAGSGEESFNGIPYYVEAFNDFAQTFVDVVNKNQNPPILVCGEPPAGTIAISDEWAQDPMNINTADGALGQMLSDMNSDDITWPNGDTCSMQDYVGTILANNANDTNYYRDMTETKEAIVLASANERASVMLVNIDEELMKMKTYQYQFEACAAMMKTMNEMMDVILMLGEY